MDIDRNASSSQTSSKGMLSKTSVAVTSLLLATGFSTDVHAQNQDAATALPTIEVTSPKRRPNTRNVRYAPAPAADNLPPVPTERPLPAEGSPLASMPPVYAGGQVAAGGQVGMLGNKQFMDTPFNAVSFTSKLFRDQQAQTVAEFLETNDASVRSSSAMGGLDDQFMIRGFKVFNQDVALNGLFGAAPFQRILPNFIERFEVIKGPSALLNGMSPGGSVGGSINLVTKKAGDRPLTRLTTGYLSDSNFGADLDVGRRWGVNNEFGARVNLGYRDGATSIDRQSLRDGSAALNLDYRGEAVRLSGDFYFQEQTIKRVERPFLLAPGAGLPVPIAGTNISLPDSYSRAQEMGGMLRGEVDLAPSTTVFGAVGANRSRMDATAVSQYNILNAAGDVSADFGSSLQQNFDRTSGEVGIKHRVALGPVEHDLTVVANRVTQDVGFGFDLKMPGLSNLYRPVFNQPGLPFVSAPVAPSSDLTMSSVAIADTMSMLNKAVQVTVGVRNQRVEVHNFPSLFGPASTYDEQAWTPMAGIVLRPTDYLAIYANYIEGLTQGGIAPVGTLTNSGEALPPARSKQVEVGAKLDFGTIGATASVFEIEQPSAFVDVVTNTYVQDARQVNRGVELSTFGQLSQDLRILASALWLDAEQTATPGGLYNGNRAVGTAKFYGNAGLEWDAPFIPGLTLVGRVTYTGSAYQDAANTALIPAWHRFDVGTRYTTEFAGYRTVFRGDITNVSGENYWSVDGAGYMYIGAPRTYRLSMTIDF